MESLMTAPRISCRDCSCGHRDQDHQGLNGACDVVFGEDACGCDRFRIDYWGAIMRTLHWISALTRDLWRVTQRVDRQRAELEAVRVEQRLLHERISEAVVELDVLRGDLRTLRSGFKEHTLPTEQSELGL